MKIKIYGKEVTGAQKVELMGGQEPVLVKAFEISGGARGGAAISESILETDLLEFQFEDDTIWFSQTGDLNDLFQGQTRSEGEDFVIPASIPLPADERGGNKSAILKGLRLFRPQQVPAGIALKVADRIESELLSEGLRFLDPNFGLPPFDPAGIDLSKPVLLFIHGTGSSTEGSFGDLKGSQTWEDLCKEYGSNILAFEHRTWTHSPLRNLKDLLKALPASTRLHIVSHSRGGLVGDLLSRCGVEGTYFSELEMTYLKNCDRGKDARLLAAINKLAAAKKVAVEKMVRVACPASGTTLLSKRLDHFLNFLLNVAGYGIGQVANPVFLAVRSLLMAILDQKNHPEVLPGLEAMIPDSPLQNILNNHLVQVNDELRIIAGNAGSGSVRKTLLYLLTRLYYRTDNDFVVDTDAMFMGFLREKKAYYRFVSGETVDHFSYFKQPAVQESIFGALTKDIATLPDFKEVKRGEKNRAILQGGSVYPEPVSKEKPIVLFLPGIMGSNLYEAVEKKETGEYEEIWINYLRIINGGLLHMGHDNDRISARSIVRTVYSDWVDYLKDSYDVVVFPYDWRLSLTQAGQQLAQVVEDLLKTGQPVHLMAHSMGGLVVRDLMVHHPDIWEKWLVNERHRCILLGTPWQGSYLIPEVITGFSGQIRAIAALSLFQSKQRLLKIFVRYPGLLELLPTDDQSHAFEDLRLWQALQFATRENSWQLPDPADLQAFSAYKKKINATSLNLDRVVYVAGKADKTISGFVLRNEQGQRLERTELEKLLGKPDLKARLEDQRFRLLFTGTDQGDGSVTWNTGIPSGLKPENLYFMETSHMKLAGEAAHFPALKELLDTGATRLLSQTRPIARSSGQTMDIPPPEVLSNDPDALLDRAIGIPPARPYEKTETEPVQAVAVRVMNGHLKYARFPVMIGHFKDDGIVSAERVMDYQLDRKLSERLDIGLYPGAIGTNLVLLTDGRDDQGAIIVGLGDPENLTPFLLSQTIEQGCLAYALTRRGDTDLLQTGGIGVSTLLIGNGYGNLALSNSILAILEGVVNANKKIKKLTADLPFISEIEFIELYEDKSINAYYSIHEIVKNHQLANIDLKRPIQEVAGKRSYVPIDNEKEWWKRITALLQRDAEKGEVSPHLYFSASTGRAKVEVRDLFTNHRILESLLKENSMNNTWNRELTKTIFELLIPNDFKLSFRNQQNILLILDETTAWYPWELLHYDNKGGDPICVSAGMIRQLATSNDRRKINPVNNRKALIIGDPLLTGPSMAQLPGAEKEALEVDKKLRAKHYSTLLSIRKSANEVFTKLYDEYKVIHIASHGVLEFGPDKKTGILLSDDIVLSTAEINQMPSTPELVFVNSCFLGKVDPAKEAYFQDKFKLAANIGTELIENGVKAVVVAGWAVNDEAAKRFAAVFYEEMLAGELFGEAVKKARRACYQDFGSSNTWGAYQCYGDPYYQLEKASRRGDADEPYILEKEILIDLEILVNDASSARKRDADYIRGKLERTTRRIEASGLRNGRITELEAMAYAEIGDFERAIAKYEALQSSKKADYSVRALEQWCNLKAQFLLGQKGKEPKAVLISQMDEVIAQLHKLMSFGQTTERYALLGSAFKRKALLETGKKAKENAIRAMADNYREGYLLDNQDLSDRRIYPLTNWILGEMLLQDEKKGQVLRKTLRESPQAFLEEKKKKAKKPGGKTDFWDLIESINCSQCLLFFNDKAAYQKALYEEILTDYKAAWKIDGSEKQKNSEIVQMEFMVDALTSLGKGESPVCKTIKKLLKAFEEIK
ncbi:MAG: CHAT domain-containing protein [Lewinellaceae bacterium]|nr:CHAT domain-containing protein [Lewinellaceae bacterium]